MYTIDEDNKPLFISFSGGETSGDMLIRLCNEYAGKRKIIVLFANTGQEDERTLIFVKQIEDYYKIPIIWIEAIINIGKVVNGKKHIFDALQWIRITRKLKKKIGAEKAQIYLNNLPYFKIGPRHRVVNFETASRHGQPFRGIIAKHGIPNKPNPHCTRDLKTRPMEHYLKTIGLFDYHTAIGIRYDEPERIGSKFYPMYNWKITKQHVNQSWDLRPFRLTLKGYEGNCRWCWKKSLRKHLTIASNTPDAYDFPIEMEKEYGYFIPQHRIDAMMKKGVEISLPITFFRENISAVDILKRSKGFTQFATDDRINMAVQGTLDFDVVEKMRSLIERGVEPGEAAKIAIKLDSDIADFEEFDREDFECGQNSCEPFK